MKLYLVAFGKLRTPGLREAVDYYVRNTGAFCSIQEIELKAVSVPDKSPSTRALVQAKESEILHSKLASILSSRGVYFALDERGSAKSTLGWAETFKKLESSSIPEIAFCIGSSLGFAESVRTQARELFSLGPQTLSHEITRLVIAEQLYRSFSVLRGHPYHHEG